MDHGVVVRGGVGGAPAGSRSLLHDRSDGGEGGGEVVEGPSESSTRVADEKGIELHPSPISSEGRDEGGGVLLVLLVAPNVAIEVPAEADLDDDEGALHFVEGGRVGRGSVRDSSCVDEVQCCAMSGFEHPLGLCVWEDPIRNTAWSCGAFGVSGGGGETPVVVSGVHGDISITPAADLLRRR